MRARRRSGRLLPVGHSWRLTLIVLILTGLLGLGLIWGAGKLPEQTRLLYQVMNAQLDVLQQRLQSVGVDLFGPDGGRDFSQWLPAPGKLFGHAQTAVGTASGFLAAALIILFLGVLFAFNPGMYRDGLVTFVKIPYRARVSQVMDEMGGVLRYWFVRQVFRILLMTLCVWLMLYLLGVPGAFLLGLQAGISPFVPYLGPNRCGVSHRAGRHAAWPIEADVGRRTLYDHPVHRGLYHQPSHSAPCGRNCHPTWTLVAIVLFGSLFGVMGIALAMPLLAIGRIAVLRLYVEDCLGDKPS